MSRTGSSWFMNINFLMRDFTLLPDCIHNQVALFISIADVISLMSCSKVLRDTYCTDIIYRLKLPIDFPMYMFQSSSCGSRKKILRTTTKQLNKHTNQYSASKRLYVSYFTDYIINVRRHCTYYYNKIYESLVKRCLLIQVARLFNDNMKNKTIGCNSSQQSCSHSMVVFKFKSKVFKDNGITRNSAVCLHVMCKHCSTQCFNTAIYCCCCHIYSCKSCYDLDLLASRNHSHHPVVVLEQPKKSEDLHHVYACGCFDCGISAQIEVRCCQRSDDPWTCTPPGCTYSHRLPPLSSTLKAMKRLQLPPAKKDEVEDSVVRSLSGLQYSYNLLRVKYLCNVTDSLFRLNLRTSQGRGDIMGKLRPANDFLLSMNGATDSMDDVS